MRRQDDAVAAGFEPGETPLHQVDAAGHRGEVDALGGRAALDVGDVGLEHLLKELHRAIAIGAGKTQEFTTALSVEPCEVRAM